MSPESSSLHCSPLRAMIIRPTACLALFGLTSAFPAQAMILNGSFEDPAHPADGFYGGVPTGWTGTIFGVFRGNLGSPWPAPQEGDQFIGIGWGDGNFSLSQSISIDSPGTYELTWYANTASGFGPGNADHRAAILDSSSNPVAQGVFNSSNFGNWSLTSLTAFLSPGDYTVAFSSGPTGGLDTLLDNVNLAVVPEPGSYAALAALGCLGWAVWRRRNPSRE